MVQMYDKRYIIVVTLYLHINGARSFARQEIMKKIENVTL